MIKLTKSQGSSLRSPLQNINALLNIQYISLWRQCNTKQSNENNYQCWVNFCDYKEGSTGMREE